MIETMPGGGHQIGGNFLELADIIQKVKDKTRIGVCIDTCHIFASGLNILMSVDLDSREIKAMTFALKKATTILWRTLNAP